MLTLKDFKEARGVPLRCDPGHPAGLQPRLFQGHRQPGVHQAENMQLTGAYKIRGAYYKISTLSDEEKARGLVTASAGNHAQGVAYAAQHAGWRPPSSCPPPPPW